MKSKAQSFLIGCMLAGAIWQVQAELKVKCEAANPGKTWDDALKVIDKQAGKK